ncbi:MAG: glycine cleavage system protein GcvH [bacterium]|nr:glycine cleavage system protein GcvH [bacterium]
MYPVELRYTQEHEWVLVEGDIATIGITAHANEELGEIVFVELPDTGYTFEQMEEFGSVESVKTVSSLYLPVSGEVVEVNNELVDNPGQINESPYNNGWIIKVKMVDQKEVDDLLTSEEYQQYLDNL